MITEIRPGFYQTTLPNGVTWSFSATSLRQAIQIAADQFSRLEKRQGKSLPAMAQRMKKA